MAAGLTDVRFGDAHEGHLVTGMGAKRNVRSCARWRSGATELGRAQKVGFQATIHGPRATGSSPSHKGSFRNLRTRENTTACTRAYGFPGPAMRPMKMATSRKLKQFERGGNTSLRPGQPKIKEQVDGDRARPRPPTSSEVAVPTATSVRGGATTLVAIQSNYEV